MADGGGPEFWCGGGKNLQEAGSLSLLSWFPIRDTPAVDSIPYAEDLLNKIVHTVSIRMEPPVIGLQLGVE
jgi:hypothetical protein